MSSVVTSLLGSVGLTSVVAIALPDRGGEAEAEEDGGLAGGRRDGEGRTWALTPFGERFIVKSMLNGRRGSAGDDP